MTIREQFQCAQPLFFENDCKLYTYSQAGTFFFVKFKGSFFGVTAKHCWKGWKAAQIRLLRPDHTKHRAFFVPEVVSIVEDPAGMVCDWADVSLIRLTKPRMSKSDQTAHWFLDLDFHSKYTLNFHPGDNVGIMGSPHEGNEIDYESGHIKILRSAISGHYYGPGPEKGIHRVESLLLEGIPSLQGFSGSPIFKIVEDFTGTAAWFAGMVIRGTAESRSCFFVEARIIYAALLQAMR